MANATAEEKLSYVMKVLMHTDMPKPDYHAVAQDAGIHNANNAQKKFRAIVKGAGFDLVDGRIVDGSGDGSAAPAASTPSTPAKKSGGKAGGRAAKKTPAKKATGTPTSSKKRKVSDSVGIAGDEEEQDTFQTIKTIKKEGDTTQEMANDGLRD